MVYGTYLANNMLYTCLLIYSTKNIKTKHCTAELKVVIFGQTCKRQSQIQFLCLTVR